MGECDNKIVAACATHTPTTDPEMKKKEEEETRSVDRVVFWGFCYGRFVVIGACDCDRLN